MDDFKLYYKGGKKITSKISSSLSVLLEPGFWAVILYRVANAMYRARMPILPLIITRLNKLFTHVDISHECTIGKRLRLPHCSDIVIGSTSIVGSDVEILNGTTLGATDIRSDKKRHPTIEDGVFLGSGAKILGDITIGKNSKIGANSVVLESVPADSTAIGIPARIIK